MLPCVIVFARHLTLAMGNDQSILPIDDAKLPSLGQGFFRLARGSFGHKLIG